MQISEALGEDRKSVNHAVQTMHDKGELTRVSRGRYCLTKPKSKRARMWKIIRARRTVTAEDLAELTDACQQYTQDYLRSLEAQGVMSRKRKRDNTWVYRLKHDLGPIAPNQSIAEVDRALEWKKIQEARADAEQAMRTLTTLMEAYDEKWGEKPDGHAAA